MIGEMPLLGIEGSFISVMSLPSPSGFSMLLTIFTFRWAAGILRDIPEPLFLGAWHFLIRSTALFLASRLGLGVSTKSTAVELPSSLFDCNSSVGCTPSASLTISVEVGGCEDDLAFLEGLGMLAVLAFESGSRCSEGDCWRFVPASPGTSGEG